MCIYKYKRFGDPTMPPLWIEQWRIAPPVWAHHGRIFSSLMRIELPAWPPGCTRWGSDGFQAIALCIFLVVVSWFWHLTLILAMDMQCWSRWFSASSQTPHTSRRLQILQSISKQYILSSLHAPTWHFAPTCPKAAIDIANWLVPSCSRAPAKYTRHAWFWRLLREPHIEETALSVFC